MANNRKKNPGLYVITDITAGKCYVGSAEDLPHRIYAHRYNLRANRHTNHYLQRAFNKDHDLRLDVLPVGDGSDIRALEQEIIDEFKDQDLLYNIVHQVDRPMVGRKHSPETLLLMSISRKGRVVSEETKKRISQATVGKVVSEEFRETMRKVRTGTKLSPETIEKVRQASTGRTHSLETKAKLSKIAAQRVRSPEHVENLRIANVLRSKPTIINGVQYLSRGDAAKALNVSPSQLSKIVKRKQDV